MSLDFVKEKSLWDYLKTVDKPIYLYGMGDGALKIMEVCQKNGIPLAGIYASDEYVRGHSFEGYKVERLSEVRQRGDFITLLSFATEREPLLSYLFSLAEELEFYAPDVPVCKTDDRVFDTDYLNSCSDKLEQVYGLLADQQSKKVFENVINFKLSGRVSYLRECQTPKAEAMTSLIIPKQQDSYLDLGGYNGDTALEFLSYAPQAKVTLFEPDKKNFIKLKQSLDKAGADYKAYQLCAWDREDVLQLSGGKGGRNSRLDKNGAVEVAANSPDNILKGEKVDVIKYDVEGAELKAIEGSRALIAEQKPRLIVSAYHRNEDLFALPIKIMEYNSGYKLYLRHHPYIPAWETNFYLV